jgi:hypothetical protein
MLQLHCSLLSDTLKENHIYKQLVYYTLECHTDIQCYIKTIKLISTVSQLMQT